MTVALVVITDGRGEYLERTLASAEEMLQSEFSPAVIVDDSGDEEYAAFLEGRFPGFWHLHHEQRQGFSAAIRSAWTKALEDTSVTHVFHLEEDFTFNEPVDIESMTRLLELEPHLAQISLKRQSVNGREHAAGGFIQTEPENYSDCAARVAEVLDDEDPHEFTEVRWVEHGVTFTTNPSLIPRASIELALEGQTTENGISDSLRAAGLTFAIWGTKDDTPRVHHIGDKRSDGWLL